MSSELPPDAPVPRLCHLIKWADFDGYGFNLHAEKSRTGQFIGKVDDDSPAQHAGLREGDRIIEVNGVNISNENHRQVVERIKSVATETKLLVVDDEADKWYKERKMVVKSTQANVLSLVTPVPRPLKEPPPYENIDSSPVNGVEDNLGNGVHESPKENNKVEAKSNGNVNHESNGTVEVKPVEIEQSPKIIKGKPLDSPIHKTKEEFMVSSRSSTPMENSSLGGSIPDSPQSDKSSSHSTNSTGAVSSSNGPAALDASMGGLNLNMSASEMRQMIANRRKKDPKKDQMDIRQKYEIIQQM